MTITTARALTRAVQINGTSCSSFCNSCNKYHIIFLPQADLQQPSLSLFDSVPVVSPLRSERTTWLDKAFDEEKNLEKDATGKNRSGGFLQS